MLRSCGQFRHFEFHGTPFKWLVTIYSPPAGYFQQSKARSHAAAVNTLTTP
jgi:hypothetical protein